MGFDKHTASLAKYYRKVGNSPARASELARANSASYRTPRSSSPNRAHKASGSPSQIHKPEQTLRGMKPLSANVVKNLRRTAASGGLHGFSGNSTRNPSSGKWTESKHPRDAYGRFS